HGEAPVEARQLRRRPALRIGQGFTHGRLGEAVGQDGPVRQGQRRAQHVSFITNDRSFVKRTFVLYEPLSGRWVGKVARCSTRTTMCTGRGGESPRCNLSAADRFARLPIKTAPSAWRVPCQGQGS